jgi:mannose-6-phosphate isomerase-like protein (cupin superfamily)
MGGLPARINLQHEFGGPMSGLKWVDIAKVEGVYREPPRTSWILVSENTVGAQNLAMGVNETHVGGMVPKHKHDTEEEVMFFLQGKGQFITDEEVIELKPGICIYNPPGSNHSIVNTGDEVLKFVWIYSPQLESHRKQEVKRSN